MASQIKVDILTDSSGTLPVDCPNGVTTTELVAGEMVSDTWKNSDGTENYKCRAWVNFDGTTTPPTIRASGNVSSVVKNSVGNYTVNFTTSLIDGNYSSLVQAGDSGAVTTLGSESSLGKTYNANNYTFVLNRADLVVNDRLHISVSIFR